MERSYWQAPPLVDRRSIVRRVTYRLMWVMAAMWIALLIVYLMRPEKIAWVLPGTGMVMWVIGLGSALFDWVRLRA